MGILLIAAGTVIVITGLVILFLAKIHWLGNLPGDIKHQGKNVTVHFPIVTCILISIILTILLNVILYFVKDR